MKLFKRTTQTDSEPSDLAATQDEQITKVKKVKAVSEVEVVLEKWWKEYNDLSGHTADPFIALPGAIVTESPETFLFVMKPSERDGDENEEGFLEFLNRRQRTKYEFIAAPNFWVSMHIPRAEQVNHCAITVRKRQQHS